LSRPGSQIPGHHHNIGQEIPGRQRKGYEGQDLVLNRVLYLSHDINLIVTILYFRERSF